MKSAVCFTSELFHQFVSVGVMFCVVYVYVYLVFVSLVVSISTIIEIECLERLVSEILRYVMNNRLTVYHSVTRAHYFVRPAEMCMYSNR